MKPSEPFKDELNQLLNKSSHNESETIAKARFLLSLLLLDQGEEVMESGRENGD